MFKKIVATATIFSIFSVGFAHGQCANGVCPIPPQGATPNLYNWANPYPGFKNTAMPSPPVVEHLPLYQSTEKFTPQLMEWDQLVEKLQVIIKSDKSDEDKKKELDGLSFKMIPGKTSECTSFYNNSVSIFLTPEENVLIAETNNYRQSKGLFPLRIVFSLSRCARKHSEDMFRRGYFSHYSPERTTPWSRARSENAPFSGENIAQSGASTISGKEAFELFKWSPDHDENMKGFHRYIGVGIVGNKATQMFGY